MSAAMAHDLLFEDIGKEEANMPAAGRWYAPKDFPKEGLTYELDLGSVLTVLAGSENVRTSLGNEALIEVARICKHDWCWTIAEKTINTEVPMSQLTSKKIPPEEDKLVLAPTDQRKFLYINFDSKDDAMLVRMTILDLRSIRDEDGRGLPQTT